ncbi:NAD(P)H-hydrate epimerase [Candidatus Bathyarchaeota archaeon]|nr:MAG: NAD(P)H-hydrate epimerase [Candidatus Bathyarchaeota archaeon]
MGLKTISSREMRILDENCSFLGLPPSLLMENAGRAVADEVSRLLGGLEGRRVVVVAGTGNNGGDGMAAARHMASRGARVSVILLGRGRNIRTGEARANWAILREMRTTVSLYEAPTPDELALAWSKAEAGSADALVDAIFGTGLRGPMRSPFSEDGDEMPTSTV